MKTPEEGSGKGSTASYVHVDPLFSVVGMHSGSRCVLSVLRVFSRSWSSVHAPSPFRQVVHSKTWQGRKLRML